MAPTRTAKPAGASRRFYHGGVPGLQAGDRILPAAITGAPLRNGGGPHRPDRVYLTDVRETAAMFALNYDNDRGGTVYEVTADDGVEEDPESKPWMRGYMTEAATVTKVLGQICLCGTGRPVADCCGEEVISVTRWANLNPALVECLSGCRILAVLPYFGPVAVDASPEAIRSQIHGPAHWEQVALNGIYVAYETGADLRVILAFALLHDAFRHNDHSDPGHGARAAQWAGQHRDRLEHVDIDTLSYALAHHTDGHTSTDPTIGACWDADRIDLVRVGAAPDPRYLSTQAGIAAARSVSAFGM